MAAVAVGSPKRRRRVSTVPLNPLLKQTYLEPRKEEEEEEEDAKDTIDLGFANDDEFPYKRIQRRMEPLVAEMEQLVESNRADGSSDAKLLAYVQTALADPELDVELKLHVIRDSSALLIPYDLYNVDRAARHLPDDISAYLVALAHTHLTLIVTYLSSVRFRAAFAAWYQAWRHQILLLWEDVDVVNNQRHAETLLTDMLLPVVLRYLGVVPGYTIEINAQQRPELYVLLHEMWRLALRTVLGDAISEELVVYKLRETFEGKRSDGMARLNMALGAPALVRVRWPNYTDDKELYKDTLTYLPVHFLSQDIVRVFWSLVVAWDPARDDMGRGYSWADHMGIQSEYNNDTALLQFFTVLTWFLLTNRGQDAAIWWTTSDPDLEIEWKPDGHSAKQKHMPLGYFVAAVPVPDQPVLPGTLDHKRGWEAMDQFYTNDTVWEHIDSNVRRYRGQSATAKTWHALRRLYLNYVQIHGRVAERHEQVFQALKAGPRPILDIINSYFPYTTVGAKPRRRLSRHVVVKY